MESHASGVTVSDEPQRVFHKAATAAVRVTEAPAPPEMPLLLPPKDAWYIRLNSWVVLALTQPRLREWWLYWVSMPGKAVQFIWTITGGKTQESVYKARLRTCNTCYYAKRRLLPNDRDKLYCMSCGCPEWYMSELHRKFKFKRASCPRGKFTEPGKHDSIIDRLKDNAAKRKVFAEYVQVHGKGGV